MKRYIFAFLCFIFVLSTKKSLAAVQTLYVNSGTNLELGPIESSNQFDVRSCEITTNYGTKIILYPQPEDKEKNDRFWLKSWITCRTNIYRMTEKDTGKWELRTTVNRTSGKKLGVEISVYSYNVKVRQIYQQKKSIPTSRIWVYPNKQVSAHFNQHFHNLASCKLLNLQQIEYDLNSNKLADIKLSGQCGFKMIVKEEFEGEWTLIADLKNNTAFYSVFRILVRDEEELNLKQTTLLLKRGEEGIISGGNQLENIKMCILEDPYGVKFPIYTGFCNYKTIITRHHEGTWKAYYGLEGKVGLVKQEIIIKTYDISSFNSSVTYLPNGDVNLLCQARSQSMKFCSFIRPDGKILHVTFGVGNNKYQYYGNGTHSHEYYIMGSYAINDCGITIHKPSIADFGAWKCLVRIGSSETLGRILKVPPPTNSNIVFKSLATENIAYVKRGEPFKIKCTVGEVLSYCWLRSPNGTVHTVLPELTYEGSGLELGDCTALIETANESDAGKWTCHMGVADGPELETNFRVVMKDTHLMAAQDMVVFKSNEKTNLICRPLPESGKIIEACRWVNPRGHGINVDHQGRYFTETKSTHCRLSIQVINFNEDLGKWFCYARFSDSQAEENAQIIVIRLSMNAGSFLSNILVISILSYASICLVIFIIRKHRLISVLPNEKIGKPPPKYP